MQITKDDMENILKDLNCCQYRFERVATELVSKMTLEHKNGDLYGFYKRMVDLGWHIEMTIKNIKEIMPPLEGEHLAEEDFV